MKLFRTLILIQGIYTLLTAVWPIIDIDSFMAVTGYKVDQWLVKTVGALLIPVAITLLSYLKVSERKPAFLLGGGTAVAFITIDFYYALTDRISNVYMADGVIQIIFLMTWIYLIFRFKEMFQRN